MDKNAHLLTKAELKRRGITRYDAELLLSQGLALPDPRVILVKKNISKRDIIKVSPNGSIISTKTRSSPIKRGVDHAHRQSPRRSERTTPQESRQSPRGRWQGSVSYTPRRLKGMHKKEMIRLWEAHNNTETSSDFQADSVTCVDQRCAGNDCTAKLQEASTPANKDIPEQENAHMPESASSLSLVKGTSPVEQNVAGVKDKSGSKIPGEAMPTLEREINRGKAVTTPVAALVPSTPKRVLRSGDKSREMPRLIPELSVGTDGTSDKSVDAHTPHSSHITQGCPTPRRRMMSFSDADVEEEESVVPVIKEAVKMRQAAEPAALSASVTADAICSDVGSKRTQGANQNNGRLSPTTVTNSTISHSHTDQSILQRMLTAEAPSRPSCLSLNTTDYNHNNSNCGRRSSAGKSPKKKKRSHRELRDLLTSSEDSSKNNLAIKITRNQNGYHKVNYCSDEQPDSDPLSSEDLCFARSHGSDGSRTFERRQSPLEMQYDSELIEQQGCKIPKLTLRKRRDSPNLGDDTDRRSNDDSSDTTSVYSVVSSSEQPTRTKHKKSKHKSKHPPPQPKSVEYENPNNSITETGFNTNSFYTVKDSDCQLNPPKIKRLRLKFGSQDSLDINIPQNCKQKTVY